MYVYNAFIDTDSVDSPNYQSVVLRYSQQESVTLLIERFKFEGFYRISLNCESSLEALKNRRVAFDANDNGFVIQVREKQDIELISAALHGIGEMLEMFEENHVPESIPTMIEGHPNKVDNTFNSSGEPYKVKKLFNTDYEIISPKPNPEEQEIVPMLEIDETKSRLGRQFNHLRVKNLSTFLSSYENDNEFYSSPFKMLADLEEQVLFENFPPEHVSVSYKPDGEMLFDLAGIHYNGTNRIVEYEYTGSVS